MTSFRPAACRVRWLPVVLGLLWFACAPWSAGCSAGRSQSPAPEGVEEGRSEASSGGESVSVTLAEEERGHDDEAGEAPSSAPIRVETDPALSPQSTSGPEGFAEDDAEVVFPPPGDGALDLDTLVEGLRSAEGALGEAFEASVDCPLAGELVGRICALADRVCDLDRGGRCEDARIRCARARERYAARCGPE